MSSLARSLFCSVPLFSLSCPPAFILTTWAGAVAGAAATDATAAAAVRRSQPQRN